MVACRPWSREHLHGSMAAPSKEPVWTAVLTGTCTGRVFSFPFLILFFLLHTYLAQSDKWVR
jgi:hypothetical protein